jgi:hypothetical protein
MATYRTGSCTPLEEQEVPDTDRPGSVALVVSKIESCLSGEAVAPSQPVPAAQVGVGGVPVSGRGDRGGPFGGTCGSTCPTAMSRNC